MVSIIGNIINLEFIELLQELRIKTMIGKKNLNVLITGAGSGIGRELSIRLIKNHNANVIAVGRNINNLNSLQKEFPNNIYPISADIGKISDRNKIIDFVKNGDPLTHLINNAGIIDPIAPISEISLEDYRYQMSVNAEAPLFLTCKLTPYLTDNARVLFMSSGGAFKAEKGIGSYCISKAALEMTYEVLKVEFVSKPIYFASLRPGFVDTNITAAISDSPKEICPYSDITSERRNANLLLSPEKSAAFIEWVLLCTEVKDYEKHWNINDPTLGDWNSVDL